MHLLISNPDWHRNVASFFLACMAVAGICGAATAGKRMRLVQALPALLAQAAGRAA
ncbi:DUF1304 family protein [Hymenobacter antarcticus]|uniref:Uncharacterized protein n=1 Tax=Hymenobacter antarcticus TaxID=486270 RepID=A0ABP7R182_9BACT